MTYQWHRRPDRGRDRSQIIIRTCEADHGYYAYVYDACVASSHSQRDLTCTSTAAADRRPGRCYVPDVWKIDPVPWSAIRPRRKDRRPHRRPTPACATTIIVDFRECVTPGHLQFLEGLGPQTASQVFKFITVVAMSNVYGPVLSPFHRRCPDRKNVAIRRSGCQPPGISGARAGVFAGVVWIPTVSGDGFNIAIVDCGVMARSRHLHGDRSCLCGYNTFTCRGPGDHLQDTWPACGGPQQLPHAAARGRPHRREGPRRRRLRNDRQDHAHCRNCSNRQPTGTCIVNMSLGGPDATNGVDVRQLTDRLVYGMIVVVAANAGLCSGRPGASILLQLRGQVQPVSPGPGRGPAITVAASMTSARDPHR